MRRWHRYELFGLHNLPVDRPALLVGYHGRPIAHDMIMMLDVLHDELGYWAHPFFHATFNKSSVMQGFLDDMGFVTRDGEAVAEAVGRGEHIVVTPGGAREGLRPFWSQSEVNWGRRTGYLRVALKYDLPVVPIAGWGTDKAFLGLWNAYILQKRLNFSLFPLWLGVGSIGIWPFGLPLPVRMASIIGQPIDLLADGPVDPNDKEALLRLHNKVIDSVQRLLDQRRPTRQHP
ncbi:MAG: hypothetical protein ACI9MC_001201 [Kiritimatiellia bacterium]|jgi:hypothetical protein